MSDSAKRMVEELLKQIQDPYMDTDLVSADVVQWNDASEGKLALNIVLGYPADTHCQSLAKEIKDKLNTQPDICDIDVNVRWEVRSHAVQKNLKPLRDIKNVIAVASGKGGVGKSTTAVNLALALSAEGGKVGILDADIYGPSQPSMLGISGQPESKDGKTLEPMESYGLQAMSIGFLIDKETPMIWRGPMVTQALEQLLSDTNWVDLDYLIVDLPPGTGDIQLTLAQKIPVSGAVIVTTPQNIALLDARKGVKMFQRVDVPILGIVENMSVYICEKCGYEDHIFGAGGGDEMSRDYDVPVLGHLPLATAIREQTDSGKPTVVAEPDGRASEIYREVGCRVAARLAMQSKDYSVKFPKIVIQNS